MSKYRRIFIDSINFLVYALIYFTIIYRVCNLLQSVLRTRYY